MKVKELMSRHVITVHPDDAVSEVGRIIFSMGISGVPVVKDQKLIGILTEEDLLRSMYPTLQEVIEDSVGARSFTHMEDRLSEVIHKRVSDVMNADVTSISENMDVMKAQSIMLLNRFSRIPVVSKEGKLTGIISQGDIFKYLIRKDLPDIEKSKYATFIGDNYGTMVNWKQRFLYEFPELFKLFKSHNVHTIIDLGSWTGEYACELAKNGYEVTGVDNNDLMIKISNENRSKLEPEYRNKITFNRVDYSQLTQDVTGTYDAVICMGNSLPYIPVEIDKFATALYKKTKKGGIFVGQILNFSRLLKNRLLSFNIKKNESAVVKETLYIEFINESASKWVDHNVASFNFDGKYWVFNGLTSIKVQHLTQKEMQNALMKAGFKNVIVSGNMGKYQGEYGELSFDNPFDENIHDWLNIIALK